VDLLRVCIYRENDHRFLDENHLVHRLHHAFIERSENILHERAKSIVRPGTLTEQLLYDSKTSSALDKLPFANKKEKALLINIMLQYVNN
jgi:uncharacterized protein (UPF0305 family)